MPLYRLNLRLPALAALLATALAACQAAPPAPIADDAAGLAQQLREAVGDAACGSDAQCRSVALGAKACGGPAAWLPYSVQGDAEPRILALARAQRAAAERELRARGGVSDCSVVAQPAVRCDAGHCVAMRGRGGDLVR